MLPEEMRVFSKLEDLQDKLRADAGEPVRGNFHWSDSQREVLRAAWEGGCKEFESFLVIMVHLRGQDDGNIRVFPGSVFNGGVRVMLQEMARLLVQNNLVQEFQAELALVGDEKLTQ